MEVSPPATYFELKKKENILNFYNKTSYLVVSKFQVCDINLVKYHTVELLLTKLDENSRRATLYTFINPEYCIAPMA